MPINFIVLCTCACMYLIKYLCYCITHTHLIDIEVVAGICFRALVDLTFLSSNEEQVIIEWVKANSCPRTCLEEREGVEGSGAEKTNIIISIEAN